MILLFNLHLTEYADMIEQKMKTKVKESFIFYSSFHYLHKKTNEVSFERVHSQIQKILSNNKFRCPRKPVFVYRALQVAYYELMLSIRINLFLLSAISNYLH